MCQHLSALNFLVGEEGDDADLDAPKIYEMIATFDQLKEKLTGYQSQYNETVRGAKMDLVFFKVIIIIIIIVVVVINLNVRFHIHVLYVLETVK